MSVDAVHARNCLAGDGQSSHSVGPGGRGRGTSRVDGETDWKLGRSATAVRSRVESSRPELGRAESRRVNPPETYSK